ncbi:sensor domain-containing diguanylate cyclase [Novosphingobium aquimarinum]|uniref:sensor domain-containing diguanylate cyclase n=1 Tax=Novosphingobium aquimarinum TaxID=2682494 RepID=UPI0012EC288F|nr:sensor domain-containing diguanylate cyclase [Novosphingobium aquimarinum]
MKHTRTFFLVGLSYLLAALSALVLSDAANDALTIWAPSGIVLAASIMRPRGEYGQILASVAIASLISNLCFGFSLFESIGYTGANLLEAVTGMIMVRSCNISGLSFDDPARVARFGGVALAASTVSTLGAALLTANWSGAFTASWFVTVLLGQLVFVPVFVTALRRGIKSVGVGEHHTGRQVAVILAINLLVSVLTFFQDGLPLLFIPVLPILLATYFLGPVGAAMGVACTASIGSIATLNGFGPAVLVRELGWLTPTQFFQIYLVFLLTAALPLATALASRNASYRETSRQKRYFEMASQTAQIGHWRLELEPPELSWSDEVFRIHGLPVGRVPSLKDALEAYHPEDRIPVERDITECISNGGQFAFDARIITAHGELRYVNSRGQAEYDDNGELVALFGVFQDVTDRVLIAKQLAAAKESADNRAERAQILAGTDQLTGVPNRRGILARLNREIELAAQNGSTLTVAMLDVDHFKSINDKFGHATGDDVLKRLARICVDVLRETDGFGRLGGEEFLIVLPGATAEAARRINERLAQAIRETTASTINLPTATVSIGIAAYEPGMTADTLCAVADGALYKAKREGRDLVMVA